ncbi:MAG: hypothetical protein EA377_09150 [Phycisphaerales bacterium]|nr:MAG: hypothetical protein EA377_09150 [Phycisphaerales bacterium]
MPDVEAIEFGEQVRAVPGVRVRREPNGIEIVLMRERRAADRIFSAIFILIGGIIAAGSVALASSAHVVTGGYLPAIVMLAVAAVIGFVLGLFMVRSGIFSLFGRVRIEVRGSTILTVETAALFRRARASLDALPKRLTVRNDFDDAETASAVRSVTSNTDRLEARFEDGSTVTLARWFPNVRLEDAAEALADFLTENDPSGRPVPITIEGYRAEPGEGAEKAVDRPALTEVSLERTEDGITIIVPPMRLFRRGRASIGVMILNALVAGAIGLFVTSLIFGWALNNIFGVILLLTAVPAAVSWGSWCIARIVERETYLDVVDDTLLISRGSRFGTSLHELRRADIRAIKCEHGTMELDDKPILELNVHHGKSECLTLFVGRDADELQWIAWELRRTLGLIASTSATEPRSASDAPGPLPPEGKRPAHASD